ncbi:dihydroxyacetone kinase subunit DhaL [Brachyspira pilosicoli]|uniref:dihydroxyacetone kinase subunit DhaL n=1 Tax=Brachyspira pilosicoli TaxID=52584 RepID=UPI003005F555
MNPNDVKNMYIYVADKLIENEDYLTSIDIKIGDGDHGIGMSIGFQAVKNVLSSKNYNTVNEVFHDIGKTLLSSMGGASGVLFGTIFISGIVNYEEKKDFDVKDFADIFRVSLEKLKERGKAKLGDKTMIDALEPAVNALYEKAQIPSDIKEAFNYAKEKAQEGMENTKKYKASFGRAKYYGDKTIGIPDPGSVSVFIIFDSMSKWINDNL